MKKLAILLVCFVFAGMQTLLAQNIQISGKVTSAEDGTALPGVSVSVKGTTLGTITDVDGMYRISVPQSATALVFSFVGMKTVEIPIEGRTTIDVVLESDVLKVDEVVVTAIGIKKSVRSLGYSIQDVGAEAIDKSSNTNLINSLNGKVAGVQIVSSAGVAGASTFIEIRGSSSITGNNQPLFVVDGVPIISGGGEQGVDGVNYSDRAIDLNPADIENISVLKGGAATALYGLRAANGAIIITTKKGSAAKKMEINFRSSVTLDKVSQLPPLQRKYMQGINGTISSPVASGSAKLRSWGARIDTLSYTTDPSFAIPGGWTMEEYLKYWDPNGYIVRGSHPLANGKPVKTYDQYDFFQTGTSYDNSLSISSGNQTSTYYLSMGNVTTEGIIPNNKFSRTSFKFSGDTKLTDKLTAEASVVFSNTTGDRQQQGSNTSGIMLGLLRTPPTFDNSYGYVFPDGSQRCYRGFTGFDNPYWVANKIKYTDKVNRMIGNAGFRYMATDWLNFSYKAGIDWYSRGYRDYFAINSSSLPDGYNGVGHSFSRNINSDFIMNINKDIAPGLNLNFILGNNIFQSYFEGTSAAANGLLVPDWPNMANTSDNRGYEGTSEYRTAAWYGGLDFAFKNMLYLSFTGRNEWSTSMPADANSFFYPSVSLGFEFTQLGALQNNSVLSYGKLRASWAKIANDASIYATKTYYVQSGWADGWTNGVSFPFSGVNGYTYSDNQGNTQLKPENTTTFEVGADLRFFNNRLSADIAYFQKDNNDLLLYVPVATSTGTSTVFLNAASMRTTGIELAANVKILNSRNLSWDLGINFSNPETVVKKLAEGVDNLFLGGFVGSQIRAVAGDPYRSIYGNGWVKTPDGQLLIYDDPTDPYYGYPQMTDEMVNLGAVAPKWIMGINNTIRVKGFSLFALLEIKNGGLMWNGTKGALYSYGTHKDTEKREPTDVSSFGGVFGHLNANGEIVHYDTDGVTELPGPGAANDVEVRKFWEGWTRAGLGNGFNGPAEPYVEKTDWVRLREVTLSYQLKPANLFFKGLELYFTGRNLFLSTPYTGIDPETSLLGASNAQGLDYFNMPGTKSYTFGVKVTF